MWTESRFAKQLGLAAPIVQGPFGGGYSTVKLTAAVCEAGGLGSFGAVGVEPEALGPLVASIRARTARAFAVNLWVPIVGVDDVLVTGEQFDRELAALRPLYQALQVPEPTYPGRFAQPFAAQAEALLAAQPPVMSFVMGVPDDAILREARRRNIVTIGTATTVDEALALEAAGVDAIVASGSEAGGHRSTFLRPLAQSLVGTMSLTPQVVAAVRVPVITAGGIANGRGIAAALMLGAQGVQLGTAFLATPESGAPEVHRALLGTSAARVTELTTAFSGRAARGISNEFMVKHPNELGYPARNAITAPLRRAAAAAGRADLLALWAGQSAAMVRQLSAGQLVRRLIDETDEALRSTRTLARTNSTS